MTTTAQDTEWLWKHSPTHSDETAMGAELVDPNGIVLAACLVADGELDIDSDGCGVMVDWLKTDDVDWPDEDDAKAAWEAL